MNWRLLLGAVLLASLSFAAATDYKVTVLKPDPRQGVWRPEYRAPADLVGKSIVAILGPISEVRVELDGINSQTIDADAREVEKEIRRRIDRSRCLGRESEVAWHKAPWVRGHILLENGRILPIEIMLSGIIVGDLLFGAHAEQTAAFSRRPREQVVSGRSNRRAP